jgi:hypothetical protein
VTAEPALPSRATPSTSKIREDTKGSRPRVLADLVPGGQRSFRPEPLRESSVNLREPSGFAFGRMGIPPWPNRRLWSPPPAVAGLTGLSTGRDQLWATSNGTSPSHRHTQLNPCSVDSDLGNVLL